MAYLSTMSVLFITIAWQLWFVATASKDDPRVPPLTYLTQPAEYADIHVGTEVTFNCFVNESVNPSFPITWKMFEPDSNLGGSDRIFSNNFTVKWTMRYIDNYRKFKCIIDTGTDNAPEGCEVTPLQLSPNPDIQAERNEYSVGENAIFYCRPSVIYPAVINYTWSILEKLGHVHDIRSSRLRFDIRDEGSTFARTLVITNVSIAENGTKFACTATNILGIRANSPILSLCIRSNNVSTDMLRSCNNYNIVVYVTFAITVTFLLIVIVLNAYFLKWKTRRGSQDVNTRATSAESKRVDIESSGEESSTIMTMSATPVDVNVVAATINPLAREPSLIYDIPNTDPKPLFNLTTDNAMYQNTARPGSHALMSPIKSNTLPRVLSTTSIRRSFKANADETQRSSTDYVLPDLYAMDLSRQSVASYDFPNPNVPKVSNAEGLFNAYSINF